MPKTKAIRGHHDLRKSTRSFAPLDPPDDQYSAINPPPGHRVVAGPDGRPVFVPIRPTGRNRNALFELKVMAGVTGLLLVTAGLMLLAVVVVVVAGLAGIGGNK